MIRPSSIPDNLGAPDKLFEDAFIIGNVEVKDGVIAFGPAVLAFFLGTSIIPQYLSFLRLTIPGILAIGGAILLAVKPDYLTINEWRKEYQEFRNRPEEMMKKLDLDNIDEDKKIKEIGNVEIDLNDTADWTHVSKIHPEHGVIERSDKALVGGIKIQGRNLDTQPQEEESRACQSFASALNNNVNFPFQIYLPMKSFDPTKKIADLEERAKDPEIQENEIMKEYVETDRIHWMQDFLGGGNFYKREYYILVEVPRVVILKDQIQGQQAELSKIPGGEEAKLLLKRLRGTEMGMLSEQEILEEQVKELYNRIGTLKEVSKTGINQEARSLSANDLAVLLAEFWQGKDMYGKEKEQFIREDPVVNNGNMFNK